MKVGIIGLGQFGYALLKHLEDKSIRQEIEIFACDSKPEVMKQLREQGNHPFLHPEIKISQTIHVLDSSEEVIRNSDTLIVAVPSEMTRAVLPVIKANAKEQIILMNTAKALDYETGKRLSLIVDEELKGLKYSYALFAGGTIAQDLFDNNLLGAVIASPDKHTASTLKQLLHYNRLSITMSDDLAGTEYASAFKNVISILAGIVHGKGFCYGSETFIISRIAYEVEQLITTELSGKQETFSIGSQCWGNDMFMSATGSTRNREYGILIGKGAQPDVAHKKMLTEKKTVEGIKTLQAINLVTDIKKYPLLDYLYTTVILYKETDLLDVINNI